MLSDIMLGWSPVIVCPVGWGGGNDKHTDECEGAGEASQPHGESD